VAVERVNSFISGIPNWDSYSVPRVGPNGQNIDAGQPGSPETKPTTIPAWYYVDTLRKAESAYTLMPPKRTASLPQRSEYAMKADNDLVARNRYQTKWVLPSFPGLVKA
jgi:hypothetical protein